MHGLAENVLIQDAHTECSYRVFHNFLYDFSFRGGGVVLPFCYIFCIYFKALYKKYVTVKPYKYLIPFLQ